MASDFRLPPTLSAPATAGPAARPPDPAAVALKLLRPIDALLLPPGQTSRAEVVSSTPQGGQFNLVLRLAQQQSNPATPRAEIAATSPRAIANGAQVLIQAVSQTQLMAILQPGDKPTTGPAATLTRLDPGQFPPGTTVQARVISQQPIDQARFAVLAKVLQGANSGVNLSLTTNKPLEPGSLLTARVGTQGELRVPDPGRQVLQQVLSQGLRDTLQRQGSAEPLLNRLQQLAAATTAQAASTSATQNPQQSAAAPVGNTAGTALPTGAAADKLAAQVQNAVRQVLQQVTTPAQLMTPQGVEQAVQRSGLFLEPNLTQLTNMLKGAQGGQAPAGTQAGAAPAGNAPLPQPALAKLLSALAQLPVTPGAPPLPGADLKGALINLLVNVQQQLPPSALQALALPPGPWTPGAGRAAGGPPAGGFPLPPRAMQALSETPDLGSLLRLTAALLSRIQHHQLQSLGQSQTFSDGSTQTTWQLEIPLRDGQQFNHVQVRIQRDDEAPSKKPGEQTPFWEVRLAFALDHLGSLQAIAKLYQGRVNTQFWAEQPGTLSLLNGELTLLRDRLLAKGLEVGELSCHQGSPPQPNQALQQRWIDEVT